MLVSILEIEMKKKYLNTIITSVIIFLVISLLFFGTIYMFSQAFDTEYSKTEIKQKIGGELICKTTHETDIHSWKYNVNYKYKNTNDSVFEIGNGTYYGREWLKNEQLIKFKKWIILKTGGWGDFDKIIVGEFKTKKWNEYDLSPENIEKDSVWHTSGTHSLKNYSPSEAFINKIDKGKIEIIYKFRVEEKNTYKMDERLIIYQIDIETGKPIMKEVKKS